MSISEEWKSPLSQQLVGEDVGEKKEEDEVGPLKSDSEMRWLVLALACVAMIGNYYCYDNPTALKVSLQGYVGMDETQYEYLYSFYSFPNIILPFFGGYLCDKMGNTRALALFSATLVAGQAVFAFGVSVKSIGIMYLGRVIYGLGGENMAVGSSALLAEWFQNKEMALAMALQVAISRIGSVINNQLSPAIADATNIPTALWFGLMVCGGSFGCTVLLMPIDRAQTLAVKHKKKAIKQAEKEAQGAPGRSVSSASEEEAPASPGNPLDGCADVAKFSLSFWLLTICCLVTYACVLPFNNVGASLFLERDLFKYQSDDRCALVDPGQCQDDNLNPPNEWCHVGDVWQPPLPDFIDADDIVCTDKDWKKASTGNKCAKIYCKLQKDALKEAAVIFSIPYFISAFASPFLGGTVDLVGGRAFVCFFSASMLVLVHSLLGYSASANPYGLMVGQGLAYSMFAAALWPSVPYIVPEKSVGLAYGVITAVQNAGLAGVPLLMSAVYDASGDRYIPNVELLFTMFAVGGSLSAFFLNIVAPELNWKNPPPCADPDAPAEDGAPSPSGPARGSTAGMSLKGEDNYAVLPGDI